MKRLLVTVVLLVLCILDSVAQVRQLKSFEQLMTSLKSGKEVRAIVYYAKCRLIADSMEVKSPEAFGGMSLKTFEYFAPMSVRNPKAFVTSSETVLITHPRHGYVRNYVKIKIFEDDKVEITARYLTPSTLQIVMDETFYGAISTGVDANGVYLYEH